MTKITTEELELLLEGQAEDQGLDYKADCAWDVNTFAKDILAMSNVRDGGRLVIGVAEQDQAFVRQGISEANKVTFKIDEMRDQMTQFADPHVEFTVDFPVDTAGRVYAVIQVASFREIPVISRKDSPAAGTTAGVIYYRNNNRRPESAPISNAYDMRDVVEVAVVRRMQKNKDFGLIAEVGDRQILDNELGEL